MLKKSFFLLLLLVVLGGGYWYWHISTNPTTTFRTVSVDRGNLQVTISATGTLEPEEVVDVGAQVAGQVINLGQDEREKNRIIDYGSPVEVNTVLARIDSAIYQSQVESAKAMVEQAKGQ